jgi:hypothetical protein
MVSILKSIFSIMIISNESLELSKTEFFNFVFETKKLKKLNFFGNTFR